MRYERFSPSAALAPYVEHFWLIEADLGSGWREELLIPNGRATVLISLGDLGRRKDPETQTEQVNGSGLTGIMTRPVIIGQSGKVQLVAAQLSPFGPSALGAPAVVDRHLALAEWVGTEDATRLEQVISAAGTMQRPVERLEQWLLDRIHPLPSATLDGLCSAYALLDGELPETVEQWATATGVNYTQIYRLFRDHVGISPKVALMIARYQALVGTVLGDEARANGLAQLALLQGYYDQAHANRDFRRFTGVSPRRFQQTLNGIARMMHRSPSDLSKSPEGGAASVGSPDQRS